MHIPKDQILALSGQATPTTLKKVKGPQPKRVEVYYIDAEGVSSIDIKEVYLFGMIIRTTPLERTQTIKILTKYEDYRNFAHGNYKMCARITEDAEWCYVYRRLPDALMAAFL
jgi:hypothetical protein